MRLTPDQIENEVAYLKQKQQEAYAGDEGRYIRRGMSLQDFLNAFGGGSHQTTFGMQVPLGTDEATLRQTLSTLNTEDLHRAGDRSGFFGALGKAMPWVVALASAVMGGYAGYLTAAPASTGIGINTVAAWNAAELAGASEFGTAGGAGVFTGTLAEAGGDVWNVGNLVGTEFPIVGGGTSAMTALSGLSTAEGMEPTPIYDLGTVPAGTEGSVVPTTTEGLSLPMETEGLPTTPPSETPPVLPGTMDTVKKFLKENKSELLTLGMLGTSILGTSSGDYPNASIPEMPSYDLPTYTPLNIPTSTAKTTEPISVDFIKEPTPMVPWRSMNMSPEAIDIANRERLIQQQPQATRTADVESGLLSTLARRDTEYYSPRTALRRKAGYRSAYI